MSAIRRAETDADLDAYARVWSQVRPDAPISGDEVRRRAAERDDGRLYLVAEVGGRTVGTGFAGRSSSPRRAAVLVSVLDVFRGRGIGSALLAASLSHVRELGAAIAFGSVNEQALGWAQRRGFEPYERIVELVFDLSRVEPADEPPCGIRVVELEERYFAGAYEVFAEGIADIPGQDPLETSFERWHAEALAAPVVHVALAGDRVVGYAGLERRTDDVLGHELTAVVRTHRRRGIARALKQTQIAWAAERGYRRLLTDTHWANEAMRRLNESLGYEPLPPLISVRKELA